ncbi:hypothetical protein [Methylorubrum extorquens]|uniref:hypothetical protein n=1 Tax=Methylorubrum extorquens TaxID=408 RepID=UPI0022384678|nr:hypothetical protein [Methylorubrum extorquens]UYW32536.1 hypothetical protein OKB92_26830 [Methylorubrum extorquens]
MREPDSKALRMNLAAKQKLVRQLRSRLLELAQETQIEVCNYRLVQVENRRYGLAYVSESMLTYQNLFTQVHDAKKNGPKAKATFGNEALEESMLEVGYTYAGSLGVVLLAPAQRDMFQHGALDDSIDAFFDVVEIDSRPAVRQIAQSLGNAVVKRVHDWSVANVKGGFDADVRWNRSDGRQLGQIVDRARMERIVGIIEAASDESSEAIPVFGTLVGLDVKTGSFHLVVPNGDDFKGLLGPDFDRAREWPVNRAYAAKVLETRTTIYSTEQTRRQHTLLGLSDLA